jgi:hypothetical protein
VVSSVWTWLPSGCHISCHTPSLSLLNLAISGQQYKTCHIKCSWKLTPRFKLQSKKLLLLSKTLIYCPLTRYNGLVNHTSSHLKQTAVKASGLTRLNPYKTTVAKLIFLIGLLANIYSEFNFFANMYSELKFFSSQIVWFATKIKKWMQTISCNIYFLYRWRKYCDVPTDIGTNLARV